MQIRVDFGMALQKARARKEPVVLLEIVEGEGHVNLLVPGTSTPNVEEPGGYLMVAGEPYLVSLPKEATVDVCFGTVMRLACHVLGLKRQHDEKAYWGYVTAKVLGLAVDFLLTKSPHWVNVMEFLQYLEQFRNVPPGDLDAAVVAHIVSVLEGALGMRVDEIEIGGGRGHLLTFRIPRQGSTLSTMQYVLKKLAAVFPLAVGGIGYDQGPDFRAWMDNPEHSPMPEKAGPPIIQPSLKRKWLEGNELQTGANYKYIALELGPTRTEYRFGREEVCEHKDLVPDEERRHYFVTSAGTILILSEEEFDFIGPQGSQTLRVLWDKRDAATNGGFSQALKRRRSTHGPVDEGWKP